MSWFCICLVATVPGSAILREEGGISADVTSVHVRMLAFIRHCQLMLAGAATHTGLVLLH